MKNDMKFFAWLCIVQFWCGKRHQVTFSPLLHMQKRARPPKNEWPYGWTEMYHFLSKSLCQKFFIFFSVFFSKQACISRLLEGEMLYYVIVMYTSDRYIKSTRKKKKQKWGKNWPFLTKTTKNLGRTITPFY